MPRFFRSDDIAVGDRVVARRQYGTAATPYKNAARGAVHSDVIGHVLSVDPLVIRPQQVGGYPSDLPAVEIPAEQLYVVKKLSPRTVRNSEIRRAEFFLAGVDPETLELINPAVRNDAAWTGDHQWFLRRGEPAVPLGPSAAFQPVPLAEIASFYRRARSPLQLLVPERIGKPAERLVVQPEWEIGAEQIVLEDPNQQNDTPFVAVATADEERYTELVSRGFRELHRRRVAQHRAR